MMGMIRPRQGKKIRKVMTCILITILLGCILMPAYAQDAGSPAVEADVAAQPVDGEDVLTPSEDDLDIIGEDGVDDEVDDEVITPPADIDAGPGLILLEGYVSESPSIRGRPGILIPVPGAAIYFIQENTVVAQTISNPVGFYSVVVPPGTYTVVTGAAGFQTLITPDLPFLSTQTFDIALVPIPFNGFVPYALNPVLETSPGRPVDCTIIVENFQVIDQMVTFTTVVPPEWQAWFPQGEALMVRSGEVLPLPFTLKYTGKVQGPHIIKVIVNGGAYFAEIPVIVIVKDLPFEEINLFTNAPQKILKPGTVAEFLLKVENKYAQDKALDFQIEGPKSWNITTGNGTAIFIPDEQDMVTRLAFYVPQDTTPGTYYINVTACGEGTKSNEVTLQVIVEDSPLFEAIILGHPPGAPGYPAFNLTPGEVFEIPFRVHNNWGFPLSLLVTAEVGENWGFYIKGLPTGRIRVEPGASKDLILRSRVPNASATGNYTAIIYVQNDGQNIELPVLLNVYRPEEPQKRDDTWKGALLTTATAGTILTSLVLAGRKRYR